MKRVLWLLVALSGACADSVRYTIESYTLDDQPCMSDCINGTCIVGSGAVKKECRPGRMAGYQYYTVLKESDKPLCLSRCWDFDNKEYDWCYVTEDLDWDYCITETNREVVKHEFTDSLGACKGACANREENYYWCKTFMWELSWDYCTPGIYYEYLQSYTPRGNKCLDQCKKKDGESYNWCMTAANDQKWDYCAEPASSIFGKNCHGQCSGGSKRNDDVDELDSDCFRRPGLVRDLAAMLESQPDLTTRPVDDPLNPVTSFTVGQPNVLNAPVMPYVVRAHITPPVLPPPNSRPSDAIPSAVRTNLRRMGMVRDDPENNNDEAGHLIAYQNGGPAAVYNFAPQTRRLNRGTNDSYVQSPSFWYLDEITINDWVLAGGSVDETVVVLYDNLATNYRPVGFGTSMSFLNPDGTLNRTCPDYFFSNDPSFY